MRISTRGVWFCGGVAFLLQQLEIERAATSRPLFRGMGWARVAPSSRLLILIILTTAVTVVVCVASCVILWRAPQVPFSGNYNGGEDVHAPALVLAATALVAALSLFSGAFGLSRDSKAALILYCVMCVVVVAGELVGSATVFTFAYIGKLESAIGSRMRHDLDLYDNSNVSSITDRINSLQFNHHCCGVERYTDWNNTKWKEREAGDGQLAPESCCRSKFSSGRNCSSNISMIYHTGCVDVLLDRTKIAVDSSLGGCVLSAVFNLVTVALVIRAVYYIRRYQNYSVL